MKIIPKVRIGLIIHLLIWSLSAQGQVRLTLDTAAVLSGRVVNGVFINKAKGNVAFTHEQTKIYCDSALIYRAENRIEAFGHVKIIENDSTTITARRANYDGNTKLVEFRNKVVFIQKGGVSLYTDFLDYDREKKLATYFNGGRLEDSINVLKSIRGYYYEYTKMASFGKKVEGKNPDWTLKSDTLQYNTQTKVIYFHSKTILTNPDGETAEYNSGNYNTASKTSQLQIGKFATKTYFLQGIKINIDDRTKFYTAESNVLMVAKNDDVIITGQNAVYDKANGITKIWNNPLMKKALAEGDTLYLKADTLVSIETAQGDDRLLAYHNVKIYKTDLQGICDSLAYHPRDSIIHFYKNPIMWAQESQLSADTMNLMLNNNKVDKMNMKMNSFIISQDSTKHFNQVKGRMMTTYFHENSIQKVDVNGNGQSIYYVLEENEIDVMGMNSVECSNMLIKFRDNMVSTITFYLNAEGDFIPPHELVPGKDKLEGFDWKIGLKPSLLEVISSKLVKNH